MRKILLAVCGLAPQVVTETLYALQQQDRLPDTVRILTTQQGVEACHAQLFAGGSGQYHRFLQDYNIDPEQIDFLPRAILPVLNNQGLVIDDISDEDDNRCFLSACMQLAFEYSGDTNNTIYYSIAGGRKTMGSCLSLAAQLYGRPQDRIFHILVTPEFENSKQFYYPPNPSRAVTLYDRKQQPYQKNTRYAQVQLVPLPFIPLRGSFSRSLLQQPETPSSLMMSLVQEKKPVLAINLKERTIIWKNRETDLSPVLLALYAFFAEHKKGAECQHADCPGCQHCTLNLPEILSSDNLDRIATLYQRIRPGCDIRSMSDTGISSLSAENFNSTRSKLNKRLEEAFGAYEKKIIQLAGQGSKPGVRYGLILSKNQLTLSW
ncbi:MAG: CRISPR-associated ring nuclease Csm6 [Desulfuromusa sp.]